MPKTNMDGVFKALTNLLEAATNAVNAKVEKEVKDNNTVVFDRVRDQTRGFYLRNLAMREKLTEAIVEATSPNEVIMLSKKLKALSEQVSDYDFQDYIGTDERGNAHKRYA